MSAADVIAAMHTAGGKGRRLTKAWLTLAQMHEPLRAALRGVFGKRLPTPQKLGGWLNEHTGQRFGDLTLLGQHSSHAKAWRYAVVSDADVAQAAADGEAERARREALMKAEAEKNAARREAYRLASLTRSQRRAEEPLTIAVQAPASLHEPPPEREFIVHVDSSDGTRTREYLPLPRPKDAPKVAVPDEPQQVAWTPGCGRPYTVADAAARHKQVNARPGCAVGGHSHYDPSAGGVSELNGTRLPSGGGGTLWKGTLRDL